MRKSTAMQNANWQFERGKLEREKKNTDKQSRFVISQHVYKNSITLLHFRVILLRLGIFIRVSDIYVLYLLVKSLRIIILLIDLILCSWITLSVNLIYLIFFMYQRQMSNCHTVLSSYIRAYQDMLDRKRLSILNLN